MRVVVVGAGPAGSVAALMLVRRGHEVTVVDRNAGPLGEEPWERKGVFQFHLPHAYRTPTVDHLRDSLPDVYDELIAAGARPMIPPGSPVAVGLFCRRELFDTTLWLALRREPGLVLRAGHVDGVEVADGVATGIRVDGEPLAAELVVDASGRSAVSARWRGQPEGGPCGFSYIARTYRLRPGADPGPVNAPPGHTTFRQGYGQIVFRHDNGYFNVLIVRASADPELAELRHEENWNRALRLLPGAAAWTAPERAEAVGPVRAGGGLTNSYLGQATGVSGLLAVGDAVATTNPTGGRGVSLGIASAVQLTRILTERPRERWAADLDAWGEANLRPWVRDQIEMDAAMLSRWAGTPVDPDAPLPVDLLSSALLSDPGLLPAVIPYLEMAVTSASLDGLRGRAREIIAAGWRPAEDDGPTRGDLVAVITDRAPVQQALAS